MAKNWFNLSAGAILTVTSVGKLWSAGGGASILERSDPIFHLQFAHLMFFVGILELVVAGICLFSRSQILAQGLVAWLATSFLTYRLGLWWIGWHRPCRCLGNVTDALHIPAQTAETFMKIVLAYLLIGSYSTLFWHLWRRKRTASASLPAQ